MTADATGPVPDDVIDAVADAVFDDGLAATWMECFAAARAVLSVPAVAAVFARDTQVREIVGETPTKLSVADYLAGRFETVEVDRYHRIAALYAEEDRA